MDEIKNAKKFGVKTGKNGKKFLTVTYTRETTMLGKIVTYPVTRPVSLFERHLLPIEIRNVMFGIAFMSPILVGILALVW